MRCDRVRRISVKLSLLLVISLLLLETSVFVTLRVVGTVGLGQGICFNQVDFTWPGATTLNSNTGEVVVDIATLKSSTETSTGFINIFTSLGWVVQNLPIFANFPYSTISTKFQLSYASGIDVTSLDAFVDFSPTPVTSFTEGPFTTFMVGNVKFKAQGKGSSTGAGTPILPPGVVVFNETGPLQNYVQSGHPNVETAVNQCGPAAAANSLQWLENSYGIVIPHDNVPGLRGAPANSLVGQLDLTMNRAATSRCAGEGVTDKNFVKGKLTYLANNGLGDALTVKHQDDAFGGEDIIASGLTSKGCGVPSAAFIITEISNGQDVELGYTFPGGGHWVELVGAGTIGGVPWISYKSDHVQCNDTTGTDRTDFSNLRDTDGDGLLNLVNEANQPNADIVVSQSPVGGVGGIVVSMDKFGLLVPYIGLASTILVATVATAVYVKRVKRRKEKQ